MNYGLLELQLWGTVPKESYGDLKARVDQVRQATGNL